MKLKGIHMQIKKQIQKRSVNYYPYKIENILKSKDHILKINELLLKVLCYNIRIFVLEILGLSMPICFFKS